MKIILFLPNLKGGGAERVSINLANIWAERGFDVEFVLMKIEGELLSLLSKKIRVISLGVERIKSSILPLHRHLQKSSPDVMLVSMWPLTSTGVMAWLLAGSPGKIFLTDHNQLSVSCVRELGISPRWLRLVMGLTYPFASGVMAVSKGVAEDISRLSGFSLDSIKVIYNPAAMIFSSKGATAEVRERLWGAGFDYHILTVGSFKHQKNHGLLIDAFAKLQKAVNAKLIILGEGDLRSSMEHQIASLGLKDKVSLPGFYKDPYPWFRSADLFVLSSDWEGFGNVIVEALGCGVPVVSTDCPSGPAEILENGRYGRLVPVRDEDALVNAMASSLIETHERDVLINRAKDFSVEKISEEYLDYFGLPHHD